MSRARTLAAIAIAALAGCNPPAPKAPAASSSAARPRAAGSPVVLQIRGKGTAGRPVHVTCQEVHNRVDYDLLASSFESKGPQGSLRSVFQDARVTFRDHQGSTIAANAPQAVIDQNASTVTLLDGVRARTSAGMTLQCTQLVYDRASQMLHGTGDVVVTDPKGFRATGSRFDSDISLTHMRMQ
jgi:hypothetical protein